MKKKILAVISAFTAVFMMSASIGLAHSGRTDANGGHRDNKNKSGLGGYHYHCGGHPAHLHTNGVCPYGGYSGSSSSKKSTSPTTYSQTSQDTYAPAITKPTGLEISDIRVFVNGTEIPTFYYNGNGGTVGVITEDLAVYGFDVIWDGNTQTLSVTHNSLKPITPIDMTYYRSLGNGAFFSEAYNSGVNVVFYPNGGTAYPPVKLSAGGYTFIPIDSLAVFGNYTWNGSSRTIDLIPY